MPPELELLYATLTLREFAMATLPDYLRRYLRIYPVSLCEEFIADYATQICAIAEESTDYAESLQDTRLNAFANALRTGHTIPACFAAALSAKENDDA